MPEFSLERLRELRQAPIDRPIRVAKSAIMAGQIRRLEDMDGLADSDLVVVLEAPQDQPTALVAIVDYEAWEATEWDVLVSLEAESNEGLEWAVWTDAHAVVWSEQLVGSDVIAQLTPEVTAFLRLLADQQMDKDQGLGIALPIGCRFGLIRTVPGDSLWRRRANRVKNLQALGEEAWASEPATAAAVAPELLNHWRTGQFSWKSLLAVSRSAGRSPLTLFGGDLIREAATQAIHAIASMDPTAMRALDSADVIQGLHKLAQSTSLRPSLLDEPEADEVAIGIGVTEAANETEAMTIVLFRTSEEEPKMRTFQDRSGVTHSLVTQLVGESL